MTEVEALKKEIATLKNDLRIANDRHQSAVAWAMNNAKTLHSHLKVCKHDKYLELAESAKKKTGTATAMLIGKRLLKRG